MKNTDIDLEPIFSNKTDGIDIDLNIEFDKDKYHHENIINLDKVNFHGKIEKGVNEEIKLIGNLKGIMVINDSISLEEVSYHFFIEIDENVEEILENGQNTLDILEVLWQNIVLEVPLRYTEVEDYSKYSGDGWKLISEEDLNKNDNPFMVLKENKKEE